MSQRARTAVPRWHRRERSIECAHAAVLEVADPGACARDLPGVPRRERTSEPWDAHVLRARRQARVRAVLGQPPRRRTTRIALPGATRCPGGPAARVCDGVLRAAVRRSPRMGRDAP